MSDDVRDKGGEVVISRGSRAQLVAVPTSDSKDTNLDLRSVTVNGRRYLLAEQNAGKSSAPGGLGANKRTGKYVGVVRQLARFWVRFSAAVKVQPLGLSRAGLEALARRSIPDEKSLSRLRLS